jgi:hypothetical protein
MKTEPTPLAARRAELVAQCAQQRVDLAHELHALRTPLGAGGVRAWLGAHKTTLLGAGGVVCCRWPPPACPCTRSRATCCHCCRGATSTAESRKVGTLPAPAAPTPLH